MRADPSYCPTARGSINTINIYGLPVTQAHQLDDMLIARLNRQITPDKSISGYFMRGNPITLWFVPDANQQWPTFVDALHQILMDEFGQETLEYRTHKDDWYVREPDGNAWLEYCAETQTHYQRPTGIDKLAG